MSSDFSSAKTNGDQNPASHSNASNSRPIQFPERAKGVLNYLKMERRALMIGMFVAFIVTVSLANLASVWDRPAGWWETLIGIVNLLTFVIGVAVFVNEATENWEKRLPRRLSVFFVDHKGKTRMVCHRAYLSGDGDVRAWGQQLGAQIADVRALQLNPIIDVFRNPGQCVVEGRPFVHFYAIFYLREIPADLKKELEGRTGNDQPEHREFCKVLHAKRHSAAGQDDFTFEPCDQHTAPQVTQDA